MSTAARVLFALLVATTILLVAADGGGGHGGHDHVVIYAPSHIKEIKHTHTIYKIIEHDGGGEHKHESFHGGGDHSDEDIDHVGYGH